MNVPIAGTMMKEFRKARKVRCHKMAVDYERPNPSGCDPDDGIVSQKLTH
jgi:hypothetical protein